MFPVLYFLLNARHFHVLSYNHSSEIKWWLNVILIRSSFLSSNTEHPFMGCFGPFYCLEGNTSSKVSDDFKKILVLLSSVEL